MPTKNKRSKTPDSPFLFVNEDAKSVTRIGKDAELGRFKQSHVQRQNFARKRQLRAQASASGISHQERRGGSSRTIVPGPSDTSSRSTSLSTHTNLEQDDKPINSYFPVSDEPGESLSVLGASGDFNWAELSPFSVTTSPRLLQQTPDFVSLYHTDQFDDTAMMIRQNHASEISGDSSALHFDSFLHSENESLSGAPRTLEKWAPPLIRYYTTVLLPNEFFTDSSSIAMGQIRHASAIHADMQACMAKPAHLYALLTSVSAQMLAHEGKLLLPDLKDQDYNRVPMFFKTKAIESLRVKLSRGQLDRRLVVDVQRLMAAAIYSDDFIAAEAHYQALVSMIKALGGIETFDDYFREKLLILDILGALKNFATPMFPLTWDPGRIAVENLITDDPLEQVHRMPSNTLCCVANAKLLAPSLAEILDDLHDFVKISKIVEDRSTYIPRQAKWLTLRRMAIAHRLLSLQASSNSNAREDCLRIALLFWTILNRSPYPNRRFVSKQVHGLRLHLEEIGLTNLWHPFTEDLLWIAVTVGMLSIDDEDRDWFAELASKACSDLGLGQLDDLEKKMLTFLYDKSTQRAMLVAFAASIWRK